jgi:hypothetical protein
MGQVQVYCFFFSYAAAFALELLRSFRVLWPTGPVCKVILPAAVAAGVAANTLYLLTRSRVSGLPPLLSSQQDWLLVLSWLGGVSSLVITLTYSRVPFGLFMLPAVLVMIGLSLFVSDSGSGDLQATTLRRWGMIHAASLVVGAAAVLGTAVSGMMYLLGHRRLKGHSCAPGLLGLPSLERLMSVNVWMVLISFGCLSAGIASGFVLIGLSARSEVSVAVSLSDPVLLATGLLWLGMCLLLVKLLGTAQKSGRSVAQMSLFSGVFLILAVIGPMTFSRTLGIKSLHGGATSVPATPDILSPSVRQDQERPQ